MEDQDRRERLKAELRDRIKTIQFDIARVESQIITATDEKKIHEEDLQFHIELLDKLGGFDSNSDSEEEDISIEIVKEEGDKQQASIVQRSTVVELTGAIATQVARKPTKAEIQEAKEKAKAWHLDRKREKERKHK
jgi:hypothetical protein